MQFHWGDGIARPGSEHLIDSRRYPLEIQLVHRNIFGAVAVLAILADIGEEDNVKLEPLLTAVGRVNYRGLRASFSNFSLDGLLPIDLHYYCYSGSLTTPPCSENVTWIVLRETLLLSARQLSAFSGLYSIRMQEARAPVEIVDNWRPIQALNGRRVKSSAVPPIS